MGIEIDEARMLADLRHLARFGKCETGVDRRALTAVDMEARLWLLQRMQAAGLEARIDGVGNVSGRTPHRKHILIGSHTDTVPKGGWLDGALGVIYGLEIARAFAATASDIGIEVISFSDEEGHFLPFLGSKLFCGILDWNEVAGIRNAGGDTLADTVQAHGLGGRSILALDPVRHVAYLEAHIEQGPVLEADGARIGIVTDIVGVREKRLSFFGEANHAGTTPMGMRRDAGAALARFADTIGERCRHLGRPDTVWNLSRFLLEPDASNVVPSLSSCTFQFRSTSADVLEEIDSLAEVTAAEAANTFGTTFEFAERFRLPPVPMAPGLLWHIESGAHTHGLRSRRMPSGAGHDAMIVGPLLPSAMLFVPSERGISHNTAENTSADDLCCGLTVLATAIEQILQSVAA